MDWFLYDIGLRHERVKNNYFEEHLRATASDSEKKLQFHANIKRDYQIWTKGRLDLIFKADEMFLFIHGGLV